MFVTTHHFREAGNNPGQYIVRPVEPDEWRSFATIAGPAYADFYWPPIPTHLWDEEEWREILSDPSALTFGLYHDGELVGMNHIDNADWDGAPKNHCTVSIYLKDEYRQQKLGQLLCMNAIQYAAQHGLSGVFAEIGIGNKASKKLFHSLGFKKGLLALKMHKLDLDRIRQGNGPAIICYDPK